MADYESKLADWFKYVDRQAEAVKHKDPESPEKAEEEQPQAIISKIPAPQATEEAKDVRQDVVVAEPRRISELRRAPAPEIMDDTDIPDIEDFLPFLKETRHEEEKPVTGEPHPQMSAPAAPPPTPTVPAVPTAPPEPPRVLEPGQPEPNKQRNLFVSEGTGMPRPRNQTVQEEAQLQPQIRPEPNQVERAPRKPLKRAVKPPIEMGTDANDMWGQLPKHIQLLVGTHPKEIAQTSYKEFKETRQELVHRLLDPPLTLEEAARILNVCPTTVRRYTNRGALPHFRTEGNQRRFRLSDVLAFMEGDAEEQPEE